MFSIPVRVLNPSPKAQNHRALTWYTSSRVGPKRRESKLWRPREERGSEGRGGRGEVEGGQGRGRGRRKVSLEGYGGGKQQTYAPSLLPLLTHYASFFAATRNPTAPPSQPPSHRPGHPTGSGAASRGHACNDQDTSSAHPPPPPPRRTDLLSHVRVSALGGEGREYSARAQPVTPLLHVSRHLEQVIRPETRATRDHGPNAKLSRLRTRPPKNAAGCLAPPHLR